MGGTKATTRGIYQNIEAILSATELHVLKNRQPLILSSMPSCVLSGKNLIHVLIFLLLSIAPSRS